MLPERWRAEVDALLARVAIGVAADTTSLNLSCGNESYSRNPSAKSTSVDMQVAAYQALLASLLAPCGHRPPYLAQGLALFRNGILSPQYCLRHGWVDLKFLFKCWTAVSEIL